MGTIIDLRMTLRSGSDASGEDIHQQVSDAYAPYIYEQIPRVPLDVSAEVPCYHHNEGILYHYVNFSDFK